MHEWGHGGIDEHMADLREALAYRTMGQSARHVPRRLNTCTSLPLGHAEPVPVHAAPQRTLTRSLMTCSPG